MMGMAGKQTDKQTNKQTNAKHNKLSILVSGSPY